ATGTGVAPFLSILQTAGPWQRFQRVVLVYAVRQQVDLAYGELMDNLHQAWAERVGFAPVISRAKVGGSIHRTMPASISDGVLESIAGLSMSPRSQFMLCRNPGMVQDATRALEERGFTRSANGTGNITIESYW